LISASDSTRLATAGCEFLRAKPTRRDAPKAGIELWRVALGALSWSFILELYLGALSWLLSCVARLHERLIGKFQSEGYAEVSAVETSRLGGNGD
jgi:hypothetical protein